MDPTPLPLVGEAVKSLPLCQRPADAEAFAADIWQELERVCNWRDALHRQGKRSKAKFRYHWLAGRHRLDIDDPDVYRWVNHLVGTCILAAGLERRADRLGIITGIVHRWIAGEGEPQVPDSP